MKSLGVTMIYVDNTGQGGFSTPARAVAGNPRGSESLTPIGLIPEYEGYT